MKNEFLPMPEVPGRPSETEDRLSRIRELLQAAVRHGMLRTAAGSSASTRDYGPVDEDED